MIDSDIIKRCQRGEEDACDELFKAVGKKALWTAYLMAGCMDIAEDIIQEAFFECFRCIKNLQNPQLFPAWFKRILVRTCRRIIQKEKRKLTVSFDDDVSEALASSCDDFEKVEMDQTSLTIRKAVNGLNPEMRMTVILYYYDDMTIREIAQAMNCFQGTVKSRLYYAKKVLEKELRKEFTVNSIEALSYQRKECSANE